MRGVDINNPMQNYWRNGNMDFFQRRTTATLTTTSSVYVADRVRSAVEGATSKSITIAQSSSILPPTNYLTNSVLQVANNTIISSFASSDTVQPFLYAAEGSMVQHLNVGSISVGFWLWTSFSGSVSVSCRNTDRTKSYVQMVSVISGFNFYVVYIPLTEIVIPGSAAEGFRIDIAAITGSTFNAPSLNQWVNGSYISHSSATNWASSTGAKFYLAQCQIRQGIVPYNEMKNTFSRHGITIDQELRDCQRYYEKSYNVNVLPGTVTNVGSHICTTPAIASTVGLMSTPFKVFKRASAAYVSYSPLSGASNTVGANSYGTSYVVICEGSEGCGTIVAASSFGVGQYSAHFTADSEY